jgi:hypothetical protein
VIRKRGQEPLCEAPFGPFRQRFLTPFPDKWGVRIESIALINPVPPILLKGLTQE